MKHGDANAKGAWQQPLYDPGRGSIAAPARADYAKKLKRRNSLAAQESPEKGQQLPSTKPLGIDRPRELARLLGTKEPEGNKGNRSQHGDHKLTITIPHDSKQQRSAAQQRSSAPRR